MATKCDKCKKNNAVVSYTETINGKTRHLNLCDKCSNKILAEKEKFLNSFFDLDPFREIDKMFDSMFGSLGFAKQFMPEIEIGKNEPTTPPPAKPKPQQDKKEERLRELKQEIDDLKQEEGIAVMIQDYMKAAEIKKKREKLQKEAEKIIYS